MTASARFATPDDLPVLRSLYSGLEEEMTALSGMWPLTSGFEDPVEATMASAIEDEATVVVVGEFDGYPFGFLVATVDRMLAQAGSERLGSIRLVYVDHEAREVGVGEAMRDLALAELRSRGISKFDAHVLPGHRLAKNFFEQGGFSARHIVMHHDDHRE